MKCSFDISNFLEEISSLFSCFPLFFSIVHRRRPSFLSLLFSGTLCLVGWNFPFLLCFCFSSFQHGCTVWPIVWVGLIQSTEGLNNTKEWPLSSRKKFCQKMTSELEPQHWLFPGSPASCSPCRFWTCQLHNYISNSLKYILSLCVHTHTHTHTHTASVLFLWRTLIKTSCLWSQ